MDCFLVVLVFVIILIIVKWIKLFFNDIFSEIYFFVIVFEVFVRSDESVLVCLIGWFYFLEVG